MGTPKRSWEGRASSKEKLTAARNGAGQTEPPCESDAAGRTAFGSGRPDAPPRTMRRHLPSNKNVHYLDRKGGTIPSVDPTHPEGKLSAKPLIIVCAGGFGRETAAAVQADDRWELLGFADDDPALRGRAVDGVSVLGSPEEAIGEAPEAHLVVCQAGPSSGLRRALVSRLRLPPERYATIVHPTAWLAGSASIGPGTVVLAGVVATSTIEIGSHVAIMPGVVITHDDIVEDYATLAAGVRLGGGVRIGSGAYLGAGALLRDGITVGAGAVVGMGAVVTRSVPPGEIWFGTPARARGVATEPARLPPA